MKRFALLLAFTSACSGGGADPMDAGSDSDIAVDGMFADASEDASGPAPLMGTAARVYRDLAPLDQTRRTSGIDLEDMPEAGHEVRLLGSAEVRTTDADGIARFEVPAGTYMYATDVSAVDATTHNVATHTAAAVAEGSVKIVTFGDSLPVYGGSPRFDAVLEELIAPMATVERVNLAVSGTTSVDWRADGRRFESIAPEVPDTDLFIVSLGGNDFLYYIQDLFATGGMDAVLGALGGGAEMEALAILERVLAIVDAVRAMAPEADFAYLIYPAYPESMLWQTLIANGVGPDLADSAQGIVEREFRAIIRALLARLDGEQLVLADLNQMTRAEPIDPLLFDELHFTTYGHQRVGEELFLSLGGVVVGADPELHMPYELGVR